MALTFDLVPYEKCGPLTSGLTANEVRGLFDLAVERFRKTALALQHTLDVGPGICHVNFDFKGGCSGAEVFPGSGASVRFAGEELLIADGSAFVDTITRHGQHWEVDNYGIHVPMLGIATFCPEFDWDRGLRAVDALYVSLDPNFIP